MQMGMQSAADMPGYKLMNLTYRKSYRL